MLSNASQTLHSPLFETHEIQSEEQRTSPQQEGQKINLIKSIKTIDVKLPPQDQLTTFQTKRLESQFFQKSEKIDSLIEQSLRLKATSELRKDNKPSWKMKIVTSDSLAKQSFFKDPSSDKLCQKHHLSKPKVSKKTTSDAATKTRNAASQHQISKS